MAYWYFFSVNSDGHFVLTICFLLPCFWWQVQVAWHILPCHCCLCVCVVFSFQCSLLIAATCFFVAFLGLHNLTNIPSCINDVYPFSFVTTLCIVFNIWRCWKLRQMPSTRISLICILGVCVVIYVACSCITRCNMGTWLRIFFGSFFRTFKVRIWIWWVMLFCAFPFRLVQEELVAITLSLRDQNIPQNDDLVLWLCGKGATVNIYWRYPRSLEYLKSLIWFWESPLAVPLQYVVPIWQQRHHSQLNWTVVQFQELHNTTILTNQLLCFGWQTHALKNWWTLCMQLKGTNTITQKVKVMVILFWSVSSQWQQGTSDPHAVQSTRLCYICKHQSGQ